MTDDSLSGFQALPLTARYSIDRLCTRFENACQTGPPPTLEEYLNELAPGYQSVLLTELLDLDVEYRRRRGEDPQADEYSQRFPAFAPVVAEVFGRLAPDTLPEAGTIPTVPAESEWPTLPGFVVVSELGRGGMGVVYKARQKSLGRDVALKVLKTAGPAGLEERVRFRLEAEAVARLRHPNIVQVFESGEHEGRPYLVLELVEGKSLREFVGRPLDPWASARLVETLARAVHHAHAQGVIHRDLKPANVLLDARHETRDTRTDLSALVSHVSCLVSGIRVIPKIADFGLAKRVGNDTWQSADGHLVGTPAYMAPEQVGGEAGPGTDVYALGVTLYELLTGRVPLSGKDAMDTLLLSQFQEPTSPRKLQPKVPRDLDTICLKCLRKGPADRYTTAEALADDLRRFLNREPIRARRVRPAERAWKWARRNPALASLLATVLGLIVAVAIVSTTYAASLKREQTALLAERENTRAAEQARRVAVASAVETAAPEAVPVLLATLADSPDEVLPLLQEQFDTGTGLGKLRAGVALTALGRPQPEFLLARVSDAAAAEGGNLALAFRALPNEEARALLTTRFRDATDLTLRARCALLLLDLGAAESIRSLLAFGPDPGPRSTLFEIARDWHGDLAALPALLTACDSDACRSGLCTVVGLVDPATLSPTVKTELTTTLSTLYRDAGDGATHSAAEWALRRWGVEPPALEATAHPVGPRRWFVNKAGVTMIGVDLGVYNPAPGTISVVTRPYFLGAREVSIAEFRRFVDDPDCPPGEKASAVRASSPDPAAPVNNVSRNEMHLYCNWLSRRDGRRPCYRRAGPNWATDFTADGYRLPTEAEWDLAHRAGATTEFYFGNDARWLAANAHVAAGGPVAGGGRMPNRWGLYDMVGNLWEMCHDRGDRYTNYPPGVLIDPTGIADGPFWVWRGGGFDSGSFDCRAGKPPFASTSQGGSLGFRVACSAQPGAAPEDIRAEARRRIEVFSRVLAARPDDPSVLRARGEQHVWLADWKAAAADLRRALDLAPDAYTPWCRCAPVMLLAGDVAGYRDVRDQLLKRFGDATDAYVAERVAKACMLEPLPPTMVAAVTALTDRAVAQGGLRTGGLYFEYARGFAAYRAGDPATARTWLGKCQSAADWPTLMRAVRAQAAVVEGLTYRLQKDEAAARKAFDRAIELGRPDREWIGSGSPSSQWSDVLVLEVLLREAGLAGDGR